jgi:hypothetical protein
MGADTVPVLRMMTRMVCRQALTVCGAVDTDGGDIQWPQCKVPFRHPMHADLALSSSHEACFPAPERQHNAI